MKVISAEHCLIMFMLESSKWLELNVLWNTCKRHSRSQGEGTLLPQSQWNNVGNRVFIQNKWLIDWMVFNAVSSVFQLYHGGQCTYPSFSGVLLTSTPHNILSMPLAAFQYNHCRNNRQRWESNDFCHNDYHQSSERILAKLGVEPATSCSQVRLDGWLYWGLTPL